MPYQPSRWGPTTEDRRGEFALAGGKALGEGIAQAGAAIAGGLSALASKKEAVQATEGAWDFISAQAPDLLSPFEEKFRTGSAGTKQGLLAQAIAALGRQEAQTPVVPQYGKTPGGAGFYTNPRTGSMTAEKDLAPPELPKEVPNPTGGPSMGMNANGTVFEYPAAAPVSEWTPAEDGTVRHYKNGQPTGAMYRQQQKPGMVEIDGAPGDFLKVGPNGLPLENGRTYRRRVGPWAPDAAPFDPVPDPPSGQGAGLRVATTRIRNADGSEMLLQRTPDGKWEELLIPDEENANAGQRPEWRPIAAGPSTNLLPATNMAPGTPAAAAKPVRKLW